MTQTVDAPLQVVFVVTCYQSIIGVYASNDDAVQVQKEMIAKNRPADILARQVFYPKN